MKHTIALLLASFMAVTLFGQQQGWQGKFEQLQQELPTPNSYRSASGAPGSKYWQQRADYVINVEVDDNTQVLTGSETITYYNNAPEALKYLWLQLDQNHFSSTGMPATSKPGKVQDSIPARFFDYLAGTKTG